ncbi:hypothetical protein BHM03_00029928 [Ensete ventricosum]|nr:hypothetical protein BHM03_00029928 [Ensete ventricosum]
MMSQPNEVARVRKLASIVCRRGALAPICCRVPRGWWVVGAPLLHKGPGRAVGARPSPSDDQVRGTHRTGDTSSLWCLTRRQSPTVRGAVGWLARRVWPATLPSARCQGHCRLVSLSVCFVKLPVACWQGCHRLVSQLRLLHHATGPLSCCQPSTVKRIADQVETPTLPTGLIEATSAPDVLFDLETIQRGQAMWSRWGCGVLIVGGSTIIRPIILSPPPQKSFMLCLHGTYLGRIIAKLGSLEYVGGELTIGLKVTEICNSSTIGLIVAEICNSGMIGLMVAEIYNSGTIGLKVADVCNSGTIGLKVVEVCNSGTIELKVAEVCNSGTIGLKVAEICFHIVRICGSGGLSTKIA